MNAPDNMNIEVRYRTMLILWLALMMSVVMYVITTQVVDGSPERPENNLLSFLFAAVGTLAAVLSFVLRSHFLNRSVEKQDMALVHVALVVGCAFCEVPALLGIVERFMLPGRDYIVLLAISFVSMALHFPRKINLLAASYKDPRFGGTA